MQYRHPKIYDFFINFLYPKKLMEKFREEVGTGMTIFEVAAGYGRMSRYIDSSNLYYGIDLNPIFVASGRNQGINLDIKDIFDPAAYKTADIYILVDVIHHLDGEKLRKMRSAVKVSKSEIIKIEILCL